MDIAHMTPFTHAVLPQFTAYWRSDTANARLHTSLGQLQFRGWVACSSCLAQGKSLEETMPKQWVDLMMPLIDEAWQPTAIMVCRVGRLP